MRFIVAFLLVLLSACAQATPVPTATPTTTPTLTPTATLTPLPVPTSQPNALDLTQARDPSQQAFISVMNAVPELAPIDVYVERLAIATNLGYARNTLPASLVAGDYLLRVVSSGVRLDDGPVLFETTLPLPGRTSLLLLFTGTPEALAMSSLPLSMDPLNRNQARANVINAIDNGPAITVQVNNTPITAPIAFGGAAIPFELPSAEVSFTFHNDIGAIAAHNLSLRERYSYTLILVGDIADPANLRVIELGESVPGRADIRAVHASAEIGAVDIFLNEQVLAAGLEYTRSSEALTTNSEVYSLEVYAAGVDRSQVAPLLTRQVNLNDDDFLSLILLGSTQDLRLVEYRENMSTTPPERVRLAIVNTLPHINVLRIETQAGTLEEAGDIAYGQLPRALDLPAAAYRFVSYEIEGSTPGQLAESVDGIQLEPGRSYLYLITGRLDGQPPVILSSNVGIDESLTNLAIGETPSPTPQIPTRARFVNAVNGSLPLDILIDGQLIFSGLNYGSTTALTPLTEGSHSIEVRQNNQAVHASEIELLRSVPYTVLVFGFGTAPVELMVVDDSTVEPNGTSPHFRLINASLYGETRFGLAYSRTDEGSRGFTVLSESPGGEFYRRSFAFGIENVPVIRDIRNLAYSEVALAPVGPHDLHVVDNLLDQIAATMRQIDLRPADHIDIIVYQRQDSFLVEGFALRYPQG